MVKFNPLQIVGREKIKIRYQSSDNLICEDTPQFIETRCKCCGTLLRHPLNEYKFKCTICEVTIILKSKSNPSSNSNSPGGLSGGRRPNPSFIEFSDLVKHCRELYERDYSNTNVSSQQRFQYFIPVEKYISENFGSAEALNRCFRPVVRDQIIDYERTVAFYNLIGSIPTKRPLYLMLRVFDEILKRPKIRLKRLDDYLFIFFIMELPSLRHCVNNSHTISKSPKVKDLSYSILKRCIGYLGSMDPKLKVKLTSNLVNLRPGKFQKQWELLNIYLTYQFLKLGPGPRTQPTKINFAGMVPNEPSPRDESKENAAGYFFHSGRLKIPLESRFRIEKYGIDWHITTVCQLMKIYFEAHCRKPKGDISMFYNMVVDFIDYKRDFITWHKMNREQWKTLEELELMQTHETRYTTICQYPFLMSLGVKIAVMEFETGKMMEHNAEQAFLKALDSKRLYDVHFRVKVRRTHVTQDSLLSIQRHPHDLKKSLRVEFANEPGIDAGGLKKEWFLLLTRELFHPNHGLFQYVEESRLSWFAYGTSGLKLHGESNTQLYYLFGVVLGLAIYNSTILDVHFAKALYKKLCHEKLEFKDYEELYPETARNLQKMLDYEEPDFEDVFGLTFETTYFDILSAKSITKPLCSGGESIPVTLQNKREFVDKWVKFYMEDEVAASFSSFQSGFSRVIGDGLAFPMFRSCEVERLICGSIEQDMDFTQLRAVTKYHGGYNDKTPIIEWLWELLPQLEHEKQQRFLHFVTGSDRVPVTGLATLPFKITRTVTGADTQLPTAHTCFNELCLYEYGSRDDLKNRLLIALELYEGYGFK
ncbi:putative E3 ubiquitin-protein ligase HUL4 [Kluyveromyces marxianus]|uniref:HECT-type E3 ubiquitin transferase n=1 Tax=Kluyveromyces marxianus TaxID=4911 RepID=A0ABX6EQ15_KLUMA|nr:putative E3 ubiquitin-protein ligase HUL4 [Kluyveromyces marxianus]